MSRNGNIFNTWSATSPYNTLPALPPAGLELETKVVLKAAIAARAALAGLKEATKLIPNPAVLINTIPLLEAQASSEIENIVTTTDALFRAAHAEERTNDAATKEALRYRSALLEGFHSLKDRPLTTSTAVRVCSRLKGIEMEIRRISGTALVSDRTVIYTPPVGEDVLREKLSNWEKYLHEAVDTDPLVRMAVLHYQFEAIHPFSDGNGRTGRVLNLLILVDQGLLDEPILYLSRYMIKHKAEYYRLLLAVTSEGTWQDWILFMLTAVAETAAWTTQKIHAIQNLYDDTLRYVRAELPAVYTRELIDILFTQPHCRIQNVVNAKISSRQTASLYLKQLVAKGVLVEVTEGREKVFIHPKLMGLLTTDAPEALPYPAMRRDDSVR